MPSVEMVRLVSSGTEAAMSALRLARGVTGRDRILKFAGCYHGHADALLAAAGSGLATLGIPSSPGRAGECRRGHDRLRATTTSTAARPRSGATATASPPSLVEPVAGNMGVVPPEPGFLEALRALCDAAGALLVFDEVITGFRVARGGAQELYGVTPDLTILGKIAGGGLPLAAFGGRAEVMDELAPAGAGLPGRNALREPARHGGGARRRCGACATPRSTSGSRSWARGSRRGSRAAAGDEAVCIQRVGAMATLFFHEGPVRSFEDAAATDTERYGACFRHLLERGIYVAPSQFEALFVSTAHGEAEIDATVEAAREFFGG